MLDEQLVLNLCKQGGIHSSPKGNQTMPYQEKFYSEHGRLCVNDNRYHLAKIHLRGFRRLIKGLRSLTGLRIVLN